MAPGYKVTPNAAGCRAPGWPGVAERRGLPHAAGSGAAPRHATIEMTQ
jgi:hypothetical protein